MRVIDLIRGPSAAPLPAILVQGLPDSGRWELLDFVRHAFPHLRVAHVSSVESKEPANDCSQCNSLEPLLEAIRAIPVREFDRLWIDVPPLLEVSRLTAALEREANIAVHVIATCVDGFRLLDDFHQDRTLADRCGDSGVTGLPAGTNAEDISVLEPLSGFIESSDLIWLHGPDREGRSDALVRRLNPGVCLTGDIEKVAKKLMYSRGRFDPEKTYNSAAWKQAMIRTDGSSPECFRARRPFHPQRFDRLVTDWPESMLRSFGLVWLAIPHDHAIVVDQFGPAGFFARPDGRWLASLPENEQADLLRAHPDLQQSWDPVWGDRMTEIAFVADKPLTQAWSHALEACLLTDAELRMDWSQFPNPFAELWDELVHDTDAADDIAGVHPHTVHASPRLTLLPSRSRDSREP